MQQKLEDFMTLKNMGITIKKGEFVCVIGDVGSGKSTLLNAIIGELIYTSPEFYEHHSQDRMDDKFIDTLTAHGNKEIQVSPIVISESISLVQQTPWIQNKTIKDNILFGEEFNKAKYAETIKICQLSRDLEILPAGDETEIGEKGINLSGGQKARVSLARAVYADKSLILMDDPLSALDANVKKKIFKKVFMEKLSNKTRVLVTHAVDFLHFADSIIYLHEGRVVF